MVVVMVTVVIGVVVRTTLRPPPLQSQVLGVRGTTGAPDEPALPPPDGGFTWEA